MGQLYLESVVSAQTGEPRVNLTWESTRLGQLSVEEARQHALAVLEVAEAAEQDAFLFRWLQKVVGLSPQKAVLVLGEFRSTRGQWRAGGEVPDGPAPE